MNKDVISGLPLFSRGKVREMYDLGDHLLMVASDRISLFRCCLTDGDSWQGESSNQPVCLLVQSHGRHRSPSHGYDRR